MGRLTCIIVTFLLFAFRSAEGLELAWSTGQRDLRVADFAPCTLFVRSTAGDSLFQRQLRFVWAGTVEGDTALTIVPAAGTPQCIAPVTAALGPLQSDSLARVTVAIFRPEDGSARPAAAMFVLRIHPSLQARLALVPPNVSDLDAWAGDTLDCLTINGGSDVPFAPILHGIQRAGAPLESSTLVAASRAKATSTPTVRLTGLALAGVSTASLLRASRANVPEPVDIISLEDTALTVALPQDLGAENAVIALARADGATTAAPIPAPEALSGSQTYQLATVADSAWTGLGIEAGFALNPANGSYALHYWRWMDDPLMRRYYSLQDGVWLRQDVPEEVALPLGRNLAIDNDGVAHLVGMSGPTLAHYWRPPGPASQWTMDVVESGMNLDDCVVQIDTTTNVTELVYGKFEYGRHRLLWTHRTGSGWSYPEYIETGWCQVLDFDFSIGPDGRHHIVYARLGDNAQYAEIIYVWRDGHTGPWTYEHTEMLRLFPQSLSIGFDGVGGTPIIAFIDYHWEMERRVFVIYKDPFDQFRYEAWYGEYTPWWVRVGMSPAGLTHVAFYEANNESAPTGGPGRVIHVSRESLGAGMFRPWERDTVVASDDERLGTGEVVPPFGIRLAGEVPLIEFGYQDEAAGEFRICLASTAAIASVPRGGTSGVVVAGPWPNPASLAGEGADRS